MFVAIYVRTFLRSYDKDFAAIEVDATINVVATIKRGLSEHKRVFGGKQTLTFP